MIPKNTIAYCTFHKRIFDLILSILLLVLLSPILTLMMILVHLRLGSPVLFRQQRPGLRGEPYTIYKFRTMTDVRVAQGRILPDSERITPLGRILRSTSFDELPELFNVVKGDMSLVGPRPLLMQYYPYFKSEELMRFSVRPGITGLAQISGRNNLSWDSRIALDLKYVREVSFWMDLRILWTTVWCVFTRHGVQVDPGSAMLNFDEERQRSLGGNSNGT
jgi:lipopolysaccharide/colanic/teichoic acid biosynthesis glycosyltransferase